MLLSLRIDNALRLFFDHAEPLPAVRVAGISVIVFGVYLVARGGG